MTQKHKANSLLMFRGLMVFTVFIAGVCAKGTPAQEPSTATPRKVVARVNGQAIYEDQLKPEVEKGLRTYKKYGMHKIDSGLTERLREKALDRLIGEKLLSQESQKLTIEDIDEKVEQRLKALEEKYGSVERFHKRLKLSALSMGNVRESLKARIYVDEYLRKQGVSEPEISEERIREVYEKNPENYSREESIRVSHILIELDQNATAEEKELARKKAEKIHEEILQGKDFAEMAKEHSDCNSASGGGNLGYIQRGYMPEEFDRVAFALKKGEVSGVVKTRFGYHIIKVLDRKAAGIAPYEEVRGFIKKFLQGQESKKRLAAHLEKLKEAATIEILPAE